MDTKQELVKKTYFYQNEIHIDNYIYFHNGHHWDAIDLKELKKNGYNPTEC